MVGVYNTTSRNESPGLSSAWPWARGDLSPPFRHLCLTRRGPPLAQQAAAGLGSLHCGRWRAGPLSAAPGLRVREQPPDDRERLRGSRYFRSSPPFCKLPTQKVHPTVEGKAGTCVGEQPPCNRPVTDHTHAPSRGSSGFRFDSNCSTRKVTVPLLLPQRTSPS